MIEWWRWKLTCKNANALSRFENLGRRVKMWKAQESF